MKDVIDERPLSSPMIRLCGMFCSFGEGAIEATAIGAKNKLFRQKRLQAGMDALFFDALKDKVGHRTAAVSDHQNGYVVDPFFVSPTPRFRAGRWCSRLLPLADSRKNVSSASTIPTIFEAF